MRIEEKFAIEEKKNWFFPFLQFCLLQGGIVVTLVDILPFLSSPIYIYIYTHI